MCFYIPSTIGQLPLKLLQANLGGVPETDPLHGPGIHAKLGFSGDRTCVHSLGLGAPRTTESLYTHPE